MMFSYGSGLASSMFTIRVASDLSSIKSRINLHSRLQERIQIPAGVYEQIMEDRKLVFNKPSIAPVVNLEHLFPGTYYLTNIDDKFRRTYARKVGSTLLAKNQVKSTVKIFSIMHCNQLLYRLMQLRLLM